MRISLQQITDNQISLLQFSAKDEVVVNNFKDLIDAIEQNTSLRTIITYHLNREQVIALERVCNNKGINHLNLHQHRVIPEAGVHAPILNGSPKIPNISADILYEVATHQDSFNLDLDQETIVDLAMLPNNNLVLVQYAARALSSLEQLISMNVKGVNVKIMIIDLQQKSIIAATHCSFYKGLEVWPDNSNHIAVLTEEKILILDTTDRFKMITSINVNVESIKILSDGSIIAIPPAKSHSSQSSSSPRLPSYYNINPLTHEIQPSDKTNFHEINPETNEATPSSKNPKINKITVLSDKKMMVSNRVFAEMLTFQNKKEINTRELYSNAIGNQHQIAIDANTVATGSKDGIQIVDASKNLVCKAGNLYTSNAHFIKLIYFPEQALLASVFDTCLYFWKIGGRALALQGVFPIPQGANVIATADSRLLIIEKNKTKLSISMFNITGSNPALKFQHGADIKSTAGQLPFFTNNSVGSRLPQFPFAAPTNASYQTAPSIFTNFRVSRP